MPSTNCNLLSNSPDETRSIAEHLGRQLVPGDCILLYGPIGAGKSHFARSLIQKRLSDQGLWEDVPSPTFTLVQTYDDGIAEIWHADLYRVADDGELDELGLLDAFDDAITLIEWPERLRDLAPPNALHITFASADPEDARKISFRSEDPRWKPVLNVLCGT